MWVLGSLLLGDAAAFCGFYVGGAGQELYNDATMVVMMRSGTTTVLSMQNSYQGPPEGFALVVPVPQVLQKDNVKTLGRDVFAHVDTLAAPRLVEYWEQDPCYVPPPVRRDGGGRGLFPSAAPPMEMSSPDLGVRILAQFEVGEYDVVILSAEDSSGLDTWLRREKYNIPNGAEPVLRPYVEAGTKFFVAKVIPEKVTFADGRAVLSPLRIHYDSKDFSLPVRLGLLNSKGSQDLIVHILAPGQRYEVANYENAFIPTNLRVRDEVRNGFGAFYDAIFQEVARPGTVVTEYAWDAGSCDPCPMPPLDSSELSVLGGDVIGNNNAYGFVLTRLHYRYGADGLKEDLVFRAAPPVIGGRGTPDAEGAFAEHGASESGQNQFQGRYAILHRWDGPIACKAPVRGRWGGPPSGAPPIGATSRLTAGPAAQAPAAVALASLLVDPIPGVTPSAPPSTNIPEIVTPSDPKPSMTPGSDGERWCATNPSAVGTSMGSLGILAALAASRRRVRNAARSA